MSDIISKLEPNFHYNTIIHHNNKCYNGKQGVSYSHYNTIIKKKSFIDVFRVYHQIRNGIQGSSVNRGVLNLEEFRTHTKFV